MCVCACVRACVRAFLGEGRTFVSKARYGRRGASSFEIVLYFHLTAVEVETVGCFCLAV